MILLLNAYFVNAQGDMTDKSVYYKYGEQFYAEAHLLPSRSMDSLRFVIMFKVVNDILTWKKDISTGQEKYKASPAVEIVVKDESGIIRERNHWDQIVTVSSYEKTDSKSDYIYGFFNFNLANKSYKLKIELKDDNGRTIKSKNLDLPDLKNFYDKPTFSLPLFSSKNKSESIRPYLYGNKIDFNSVDSYSYINLSYSKESDFFFTVTKKYDTQERWHWDKEISYSGTAGLYENESYDIRMASDKGLEIDLITNYFNDELSNLKYGLLELKIPAEMLVPGSYELKVFGSGSSDTLKHDFDVEWVNMPLSLKRIDYAVKSLYYILSEDEYDKISSGSDDEKYNNLIKYWASQDPTPGTSYNEAMAEYYSRVDYAFFNFQTISQKDGAATDPGKIYILYGKPDKIDRDLTGNNAKELWWYDRLKKEFIFEAVTTGMYKLVKINEI